MLLWARLGKTRKCNWFGGVYILKSVFLEVLYTLHSWFSCWKPGTATFQTPFWLCKNFATFFSISWEPGISSWIGGFLVQCWRTTESKRSPRAIHLLSNSWITSSYQVRSFTTFPDRFLIKLQTRKIRAVLTRHLKVWQTGGLERWN